MQIVMKYATQQLVIFGFNLNCPFILFQVSQICCPVGFV